ncbi:MULTISPECIES: hypothetical protein [unclassified Curtobacterium]|uniref:hypothetical protein n=1 Tax=unclassified Curtobacterium TaxID=257496 RepID=UPI0015E879DB|nr:MULTISPECIES: hypothetical protein [unclassified Curtobacterium]WIB64831.1 hypothetical protein DEI94_06490 [Curtobacterium sp. MCBD17_040]
MSALPGLDGREAVQRPVPLLPTGGGLVALDLAGGAPVCEGDVCFVPGAEGAWTEVPD